MKKQIKKDWVNTCALSLQEFIDDQKLSNKEDLKFASRLVELWRRHCVKKLDDI